MGKWEDELDELDELVDLDAMRYAETGGFVILDMDRLEIVWAGRYYDAGCTNDKAKSFALWDTLQCLNKFI